MCSFVQEQDTSFLFREQGAKKETDGAASRLTNCTMLIIKSFN
jgi:hypothetical protein